MRNFSYSLLLGILCLVFHSSICQTLQVGGKIGGTTVIPSTPGTSIVQPGGTAGMFADIHAKKYRFGLRLEMNYQNRSPLAGEQLTVPVLAQVGIDKKKIVRVHAGPYAGISNEDQSAIETNKLRFRWGFSTGLDVNIPLSRKIVMISEARMSQDLSGQTASKASSKVHYVRAKALRLSISFGLAYRLGRRNKHQNHHNR